MNLFKETKQAFGWLARVMIHLLRSKPLTTLLVVFFAGCSKVFSILAMLLPLKVVILAGREGVPSYLAGFIAEEDKARWILILAGGAVVAFILTLLLDKLARSLGSGAGREIVSQANAIAAVGDDRDKAEDFYLQFSEMIASYAFAILILVLVGVLDPLLMLIILSVLLLLYFANALYLAFADIVEPGRILEFMERNTGPYLNILTSLIFLVAFFVILLPILSGEPLNVLVALVSVLALRQALNALSGAVTRSVKLYRKRHLISPLVFRSKKRVVVEDRYSMAFRDIFSKARREAVVAERLTEVYGEKVEARVDWQDSSLPGINVFRAVADVEGHKYRKPLQMRVFSKSSRSMLDTEAMLFQHLPRSQLMAPEAVCSFDHGPFVCQITDHSAGRKFNTEEWPDALLLILEHLWKTKVPWPVISAFDTSHSRLEQKLDDETLNRVTVALDSEDDKEIFSGFCSALPEYRDRIANVPLCLNNLDLKPDNVFKDNQDKPRIMSWCRWRVEPVAASVPGIINDDRLIEILEKLIPTYGVKKLLTQDFRLVRLSYMISQDIERQSYRMALRRMRQVLELSPNGLQPA